MENKELNTINPSSLINLNKSELKSLANQSIQSVKDGWLDPLQALITVKKTQEVLSSMESELRPIANSQQIEKGLIKYGTEIGQSMQGVKYDFSNCNDPIWDELNNKLTELKVKIKNREDFLKTIKGSKQELIEDTGEVVTIYEPIKSGSLGLTFKIK